MSSSYYNQSWHVNLPGLSNVTFFEEGTGLQETVITVISTIIACVGLIGNALNLIVLQAYHTSMVTCGGECTARINLLGLAVADFFVCLTSIPLAFAKREYTTKSFMLYYTLPGPGLATYFLTVSVWMVLLMSVVRYCAVCRPLTSRTWLTQQHMVRVIVLIYVIGIIFHFPSILLYTYEVNDSCDAQCEISSNSSTSHIETYVVIERKIWNNQTWKLVYHVIEIILTNIGPFVGVVLSNLAVIRACKRSDACRQSFNESIQVNLTRNGTKSSPVIDHSHALPKRTLLAPRDQMFATPGSVAIGSKSTNNMPIHRFNNRATNRVTPLLLAVIFAFLIFIAPFGIVHLVCVQIIRDMGMRIRDEPEARRVYAALNLTVQWTNVVQILGCALNFFLYFLVSTIFRRTTKRTFKRFYDRLKSCRQELIRSFRIHSSTPTDFWEDDERTNELRRELDLKLAPIRMINPRVRPTRSSSTSRFRIANMFRVRRTTPDVSSLYRTGGSHVHSCPLPGSQRNSNLLDNMIIDHSCGQLKCDCEFCCMATPTFHKINACCPHCAQSFTLDLPAEPKRSNTLMRPSTSGPQQKRNCTKHSQSFKCANNNRTFYDIPTRLTKSTQETNKLECISGRFYHCHNYQTDNHLKSMHPTEPT